MTPNQQSYLTLFRDLCDIARVADTGTNPLYADSVIPHPTVHHSLIFMNEAVPIPRGETAFAWGSIVQERFPVPLLALRQADKHVGTLNPADINLLSEDIVLDGFIVSQHYQVNLTPEKFNNEHKLPWEQILWVRSSRNRRLYQSHAVDRHVYLATKGFFDIFPESLEFNKAVWDATYPLTEQSIFIGFSFLFTEYSLAHRWEKAMIPFR